MKTEFTTPKGAHILVEFDGHTLNVIGNGKHNIMASKLDRNTKLGACLVGPGVTVQVPDAAVSDVEAVLGAFAAHVKAETADEAEYQRHVARIYATE